MWFLSNGKAMLHQWGLSEMQKTQRLSEKWTEFKDININ